MDYQKQAFAAAAPGIIKNLEKRGMEGYFFKDSASMVKAVLSMMEEGSIVSWGGSESLTQSGMMQALKDGNFQLIDRSVAKTPEEQRKIFSKTVLSDYYFMSSNAITYDGELVNIDGNGNRLACLIHGPRHIMMIVGMNKLTASIESAVERIRTFSCPANGARLHTSTPCGVTGKCAECHSKDCMCCQVVVTRHSRHEGRIKVFLVAENLGF